MSVIVPPIAWMWSRSRRRSPCLSCSSQMILSRFFGERDFGGFRLGTLPGVAYRRAAWPVVPVGTCAEADVGRLARTRRLFPVAD